MPLRKNSRSWTRVSEIELRTEELTWTEQARFAERTMVERVFSRLKDEFGASCPRPSFASGSSMRALPVSKIILSPRSTSETSISSSGYTLGSRTEDGATLRIGQPWRVTRAPIRTGMEREFRLPPAQRQSRREAFRRKR